MTPEKLRSYREKLKASGICVCCHKNKAREGMVTCLSCSKKRYEDKKKRIASGLCGECGHPSDDGNATCLICRERITLRNNLRRGL